MNRTGYVQARKLKGFQDSTPKLMSLRTDIIATVRNFAELAHFQAMDTPALEYAEVLLGSGAETDKQLFRFIDKGGRDVALRFDLTVPFARFAAENSGKLPLPWKRLQIGPVWRAEKPQKGRYREFYQCDLDIIGIESYTADLEILLTLKKILSAISPCGFTIKIGHRKLLTGLIKNFIPGCQDEKMEQVLIWLDKLTKIGLQATTEGLLKEIPSSNKEEIEKLLNLLSSSSQKEKRETLAQLISTTELKELLLELETLLEDLNSISPDSKAKVELDLSIARGLGYYTGVVFETILDPLPKFGSICSGGRYDQLTERFSKTPMPGVGGSLGLDRFIAALQELDTPQKKEKKPVFVAIANNSALTYAMTITSALRKSGITTEINLKTTKLANQFRQANRQEAPFVVTVGEEEMQTQTVSLKHMASGQEDKKISLQELIEKISHA